MDKKLIVISAININKGGTLEILNNCLSYLSSKSDQFKTIAVVHSKDLFAHPNIEYIEIPKAKKSWLHRLWHEHITLNKISQKLPPIDLWLSLHDTTPRVSAKKRAVYCHNSFPFYRRKLQDLYLNYKVFFFSWLTKHFIYRPNIKQNDYVIVQTQWFKRAFREMFDIPKEQIIVFPPFIPQSNKLVDSDTRPQGPVTFFFPASADVHKNFEVLCAASKILEEQIGTGKFETILTLKGDENRYASSLYKRWGDVGSISFRGYQNKTEMQLLYEQVDALVFPSKVETWGLPITEFGIYDRPILLADLPYAHETAGGLSKTAYFDPAYPSQLALLMRQVVDKDDRCFTPTPPAQLEEPIADDWDQLFKLLTE